MVFPLRPAPELVAAAERVALARPELGAYALPYTTLHTDATAFMSRGVPSLSFVGLTPAGVIPDWHQASDTLEHVDAGTRGTHRGVRARTAARPRRELNRRRRGQVADRGGPPVRARGADQRAAVPR
jgi:hypothetical protein